MFRRADSEILEILTRDGVHSVNSYGLKKMFIREDSEMGLTEVIVLIVKA